MQDALEYLALDFMERGTFSQYETIFDALPAAKVDFQVFRYVLAMFRNAQVHPNQFSSDVCLVGGYSIVPYIARQLGDEQITSWRGSHDIDLLLNGPTHEASLLEDFKLAEDRRSLVHPHKKQIVFEDEIFPKGIELDLYYNKRGRDFEFSLANYKVNREFWQRTNQINVFGIPIRVPPQVDIIKMKTDVKTASTGLPRPKDMYDIATLIGSLELEGNTPVQIFEKLGINPAMVVKSSLAQYDNTPMMPPELQQLPLTPSSHFKQEFSGLVDAYLAGEKAK